MRVVSVVAVDELAVAVAGANLGREVKVARQFVAGQRVWIAAVAFPLRSGQEADRHGVKAPRRRRWPG
ncbi:MAG: hypothetical protein ACYDC7_09095 [Acidithiobacillus ferrivorans]|uniref:hypothetical protein n=1 Tax=Acidithiobacillus ferrivorans TaxID=160808 RepID=UPI001177B454|nr:hypothetical protein [Acidithiobacillus ferrivorans]MBU2768239.1 hypothetical protein [Acidithiobacillus ferrivorans]MBU2850917.1 hypothetical protein [Acidithiobacillus ferrivorans]